MSDSFFASRLSSRLLSLSLTTIFFMATPVATLAQEYPVVQMLKRNASNFAIDAGNGGANAQNVFLSDENENNITQQWYEIDRGRGYYSYQKVGTDFCIDGNGGGENRQNVYLWSCSAGNQNQHWLKVDAGDDHYRLEKRNAPGYSIDGNGGGESGQSIYLWDSGNGGNPNQHWYFNAVNDGPGPGPGPGPDNCIEVDSLNELSDYQDVSGECVRVAPGTYRFNTSNVGEGLLFSDRYVLQFTGSNSTFIFDGVKFEYDTEIFRQFGRESVTEFHVLGNNNVFENLTMEDIGDTPPLKTAEAIIMDGTNNRIDGFTITTRGSYPYGYGDIFGKGGTRTLNHRKHSGVLIRGDRNHLKGLDLRMRSYGHGIFVQGGDDVLIENCNVEGELSTVNAVLAERGTGSAADEIDFQTVWGYKLNELTENYRFSLQEDGIRAYTTGKIFGTDEDRRTGDITVRNSTVKFMRSGVTIGWAGGDKYVENITALGNESGFWVGSNTTVVNSRGDASVGPLFSEDVSRRGSTIELTILDNVVSKIGNTPSFYLAGDRHNMTLKDGTSFYNSEIELQVGGTRNGHRWLTGSGEEPPNIDADDITFDNQTPYPVVLGENSEDVNVESCGSVRDNGRNNSVRNGSSCN